MDDGSSTGSTTGSPDTDVPDEDTGRTAGDVKERPEKTRSRDTVETSLRKLEEVLEKLESGDTPLEESFRLYENGMKLVKDINSKIDKIEKKMIVLEGEGHE